WKMEKLWEFPKECYTFLIESILNCGKIVGETAGTQGTIFTFDQGGGSPRYIVAKTPKIDPKEDSAKIKRKIEGLIYEVNETYRYSNHPLISRFVRLHVCAGAPFVLSVKRDRTLRDLIETGPVTINEAVSIAIQIAHALEYCQGRGLS